MGARTSFSVNAAAGGGEVELRALRVSGYVAWVGVSLLAALCLVGLASVGLFIAPVALLLGWATSLTPAGQDRLTPHP